MIGTAAYQAGDLQAARDAFTEIQQDAETPQDLWIRSGLMVSLIDGQLAAPGSATLPAAATLAATPPAAPARRHRRAGRRRRRTPTARRFPCPLPDASGAPPTTPTP